MRRSSGWPCIVLGFSLGALLSVTCGPPYPPGVDCRYNPQCNPAGGPGGVGAYCDRNSECGSGHCCEKDECDGGMCTYGCHKDNDCPVNMLCEHSECFWACDFDGDCAPGQSCQHDNRVCEW